jgi:protein-(glutamine-N5) methyltransferase, release factor-specific
VKNITTYLQESLGTLYPPEEIRCIKRLILLHVCGLSHNQQILCKDKQIPEKEKDEIYSIINRLEKMEPLQYVLGDTEFYSLPLKVNPSVLIPRPETEELVDMIIKAQQSRLLRSSQGHCETTRYCERSEAISALIEESPRILDIGTGSGCIAIALAKHIPNAAITAIDISESALLTAKENALFNNVCINFIQANILKTEVTGLISDNFDIIVSNPPYITDMEKESMNDNVLAYEPHHALFVPNEDPLLFYKAIAEFSLHKLTPKGMIYFEINANYGSAIIEMLQKKGFTHTELISDLSGKNRFITAKKSNV